MKLLVATTNEGKLKEIGRILSPLGYRVLKPPRKLEVEEKGHSFLENAYIKAKAYFEEFKLPTLADDSGLVVDALQGFPGVYSSRFYAIDFGGTEQLVGSRDETNIRKLLRLLRGKRDRRAKFVAYVVLITDTGGIFSWGECEGDIVDRPVGEGGFGYDPVFRPKGFDKTMAQLSSEEKDSISHRGKALRKLVKFIERLQAIDRNLP